MNSEKTQVMFEKLLVALFRQESELSYYQAVEAIRELAVSVKTDEETEWELGEFEEATLDNLLIGSYWFFVDYHGGQESPEYIAQSAISQVYKPGMSSGPEPETSKVDVYEAWEALFESYRKVKQE